MQNNNVDEIIAHYVALRDSKADLEAQHVAQLAPLVRDMDMIQAALLRLAQKQGVESFVTVHGTAYISVLTSAKVADWDAFLAYVKAEDKWHLLERRVAKSEFLEDGAAAPGVDVSTFTRLNIRRSS